MAALSTPVAAVEWSCRAALTIKDASGAVIAECGDQGRDYSEDIAIAAEIVLRINAYDELSEALAQCAGALQGAAVCMRGVKAHKTAAMLEALALTAGGVLVKHSGVEA